MSNTVHANSEKTSKRYTTEEVLKLEEDEIKAQRAQRLPVSQFPMDTETNKPAHIGLSFSGGGIRSATFNLGVLQGLREAGVLRFIDYLSTVSGGGYIGAWFTALNYRRARLQEQQAIQAKADTPAAPVSKHDDPLGYAFLDELNESGSGSPFIHHLRAYSRYLAPRSGITSGDTWTMVSIWMRNTFLIQLTIVSLLVAAVCAVDALPFAFRFLLEKTMPPTGSQPVLEGSWWWPLVFVQIACITLLVVWSLFSVEFTHNRTFYAGLRRKLEAAKIAGVKQTPATSAEALQWMCKAEKIFSNPTVGWAIMSFTLLGGSFLSSIQIFRMMEDKIPVVSFSSPMGWPVDVPVSCMVLIVAALSVLLCRYEGCKWEWVTRKPLSMLVQLAFQWLAGVLLIWGVHTFFSHLSRTDLGSDKGALISWATIFGPLMIMSGYCMILTLAIGIQGNEMEEKVREWWGRAGAWVVMTGLLYLLVTLLAISGPWMMQQASKLLNGWLTNTMILGWVTATCLAVLAGRSNKTSGKGGAPPATEGLAAHLPLLVLVGLLLSLSCLVHSILSSIAGSPHVFLLSISNSSAPCLFITTWMVLGGGTLLLSAMLMRWLDLNLFSMNPFYRNRLERCYLGGSRLDARVADPLTGFDFGNDELFDLGDDLRLASIRTRQPAKGDEGNASADLLAGQACELFPGPFPIINTAVNTGASAGNDVQDRSSESFAFTPISAGYDYWRASLGRKQLADPALVKQRECHRPTSEYGCPYGWTVGRSISVSGAAASPNSGYHTSPLVAFMLTIFNARLGWWAPNPQLDSVWKKPTPGRSSGFFGCLFRELTGSANLDSNFVYLSDGGHFENLGLYELVRRRCKVIIVGDGECDPGYTFQGLGMAIRRCRVDFGAEINIDPTQIRPDPATGLSRAHVAIGTIKYAGDSREGRLAETGTLIYIKSSVTGDEQRDVQQYRAENNRFPHEPTGDQFYSEAQFESYRRLGHHIAQKVFMPARYIGTPSDSGFLHYVDKITSFWAPPPRTNVSGFVNHADTLLDIWRQAAADTQASDDLHQALTAGCEHFFSSLQQKETVTAAAKAAPPARSERYIIQQMLQLMENVFLDLDLAHHAEHPDNAGWMRLFKIWRKSTAVQQVWTATQSTYGERFKTFWNEQLIISDEEIA